MYLLDTRELFLKLIGKSFSIVWNTGSFLPLMERLWLYSQRVFRFQKLVYTEPAENGGEKEVMDFVQLELTISRMKEMVELYNDTADTRPSIIQEAIEDSLVKRFDYTLEMAWKSCKRYLSEEGVADAATGSPKSIMRIAAEVGLIENAEPWMHYITARQSTAHDYSAEKAKNVVALADAFLSDVTELFKTMSTKRVI